MRWATQRGREKATSLPPILFIPFILSKTSPARVLSCPPRVLSLGKRGRQKLGDRYRLAVTPPHSP